MVSKAGFLMLEHPDAQAMHLPAQLQGNFWRFMFGIEAPQEAEPFWTMPTA